MGRGGVQHHAIKFYPETKPVETNQKFLKLFIPMPEV